ncbi:hypothetical protein PDE_05222 [Penicillium oxalicum 114-2]|uniref:DUF7730 domain-containing protein n=1 Tax=Penicillium oxalicum (strain 114-2 / CGMCC 5302) TaxID=933388 RepID=S7ZNM1_PENO1|nr:hypothetical protein PDE_05222 [Penicillium oxalicum 114-2]
MAGATKTGIFSWEDVLAQRYQHNKPPPLPQISPRLPAPYQPQPECHLLTRLSLELRLMIWESVLGGHRLHILQRANRQLGHIICPLHLSRAGSHAPPPPLTHSASRTKSSSPTRPWPCKNAPVDANVPFCQVCQGAGVTQPVKEAGFFVRSKRALGYADAGLLALVLTCRQISTESIPLLYASNTFEFSIPWTLPYFQPTIPTSSWASIRTIELRWSFPGHWLPTKDPARAIYVAAGQVPWQETCRAVKNLPGLRSFILILGSTWFGEGAERVPVFLEPLAGLELGRDRRRRQWERESEMGISMSTPVYMTVHQRDGDLDEMICSDGSRSSFDSMASVSRLSEEGSECSDECACPCPCAPETGLITGLHSPSSSEMNSEVARGSSEQRLATWQLRLEGQPYYSSEVQQIETELARRGIGCRVSI